MVDPTAPGPTGDRRELLALLERLHRHKDAAYGDAWRKRGEVIAIFANMARKYDRLLVAFAEQSPAATEPLGDTVADLLTYTAKYLTWIADEHPAELDRAQLPIAPEAITARRGPDALAALFDVLASPLAVRVPADARAAWSAVQNSFGALERALMAQTLPDPPAERLLSFAAKATLAWRLADELAELLLALQQEAPETVDAVRADVVKMDQAATR